MSYQTAVAYQARPPANPGGNNYYYGGSYHNGPTERQYNDMAAQRVGPDTSRDGQRVGYRQQDQYGRGDGQRRDFREGPVQYDRQPVNDYSAPQRGVPAHQYPETSQGPDQYSAATRPSWERYDAPRDPPNKWSGRQDQDEGYQDGRDRYDQYGTNAQSTTSPTQQNYNNNRQFEYSGGQQGGYIAGPGDRQGQDGHRNAGPANPPWQPEWGQRQGYGRNPPDQDTRQENWGRPRPDPGHPEPPPARGHYEQNRRNDLPPPTQPHDRQSYGSQRQPEPYSQYNVASDQRLLQDPYRGEPHSSKSVRGNERPPEPPQVLAKTSGSTAVFGIVAKVDTSPTRRIVSPDRDYNSQHQRQEPHSLEPGQRTSQSGPHHPPSPPMSPGSRGPPGWSTAEPPRQYGPPVNTNQERLPGQNRNRQWDGSAPTSYGQPRYRDGPPAAHRTDKYGEEFNESSGYGSESTHNTDRSYKDQLSPNKLPYEDRQSDYRRPNEPPHLNRTQQGDPYRDDDRYRRPPPPGPANFADRYEGEGPPAPHADHRPPQAEPARYGGDTRFDRPQHDSQGQQSAYAPRQPQYEPPPRDYQDRRQPPDTQYRQDQYDRTGPTGPRSPDIAYLGPKPGVQHGRNLNTGSGVEQPHVKSVRAAKDMFEKQSDPRRPPPAPKPILAKPKPLMPNNMNTRPVPPRPSNFSDGGWNRRQDDFPPPPPQNLSSPRSPPYDNRVRFDERPQTYTENKPPHSKSMYNLSDRYGGSNETDNNMRQQQQPHSQSMLNLDDRSANYAPPRDDVGSRELADQRRGGDGYRNSYSAVQDARPMVIGVKYNQEGALATYTSHDQTGPQEGRRRESWNGSNQYPPQQSRGPISPTRSQTNVGGWSNDPNTGRQSYVGDRDNRSEPQRSSYAQPATRQSDSDNYVPDVVARSYEAFTQSQAPPPQVEHNNQGYPDRSRPPDRSEGFRTVPHQEQAYGGNQDRSGGWENEPENQASVERWPTPPPPMPPVQDQPRREPQAAYSYNQQKPPSQPSYNDDWRRPGPEPVRNGTRGPPGPDLGPQRPRPQEFNNRPPPQTQAQRRPAGPSHLPPPPQQPYRLDSDSSEGIDVDAPTPPPANKHIQAPHLQNNRSESPYERNKPVPVAQRGLDQRRQGRPHQVPPQTGAQRSDPARSSQKNEQHNGKSPAQTKSPPPTKPQRNSVHITSPQAANGQLTPENNKAEFDFDIGETQLLTHATSRERGRLGRSGALANRKPPSRAGSSSNLLQAVNDEAEDGYQIEVTDQDLTHRATPIEVHREESMRVIRAKRAGLQQQEKDSSSSSEVPSVIEKPVKQSSNRGKNAPQDPEKEDTSPAKSSAGDKKTDSKLLFKIPSRDVSKAITAHPLPEITESKSQANKRPPTYLGFGYSPPEKPKPDLLTQFKTARDNAMRSAADKQNKALTAVSAAVKFSHGKKEPKSPTKPKLTAGERNAKVLEKIHVEVRPPADDGDYHDRHHHHRDDERGDSKRSSTRSTSTVKAERYDGDDDTTNGSKYDKRGRGRDRHHDDGRAKSRGRSRSRERGLSPSRGKSRGRSRSLDRDLSPNRGKSRGRSRSQERALSPTTHPKSHGRAYDDRRRYNDEPPYHRRSHSPDRHRYPDSRHTRSPQHHAQHYDRQHGTREPDWVEQFRRGRERASHPTRRAWVNDPRRVEVVPGGSRRELDMDEFEREVRRATSYNSDFEQPEPRRQMMPTKLMARPPPTHRKPNNDWMNALKERNKSATRARLA